MSIVGGWKFFGQGQFPENGQLVTVIWNNGSETDCIWVGTRENNEIDWDADIIPASWKPYIVNQ